MYQIVNGASLYTVANDVVWVKQGENAAKVGGGFTTVPGTPSVQLLPSTNTVLGYYNGQMLAYAAGNGTGIYAGLTAGALVNFDPASSDTGQAVWNGFIIADNGLKAPLPINTTYPGTIQIAIANGGWTIRQQFLYAGGTPATDVAVVQTAVAARPTVQQFSCSNAANGSAYETVFTY